MCEMSAIATTRQPLDEIIALSHVRELAASGRARALREWAQLSQAEVGAACGTTAAAVSRWESGQRVPRRSATLYAAILAEIESRQHALKVVRPEPSNSGRTKNANAPIQAAGRDSG